MNASSSLEKPDGSSSDVSNRAYAFYTSDKLLRLCQQKMYRMKKGFVTTLSN